MMPKGWLCGEPTWSPWIWGVKVKDCVLKCAGTNSVSSMKGKSFRWWYRRAARMFYQRL